ncbi:hypothetical protein FACS1894133_6640 [Clostridia bacterium]|nr:hypothetical protein FACS1894133_6640 [Clostridia bacterium]
MSCPNVKECSCPNTGCDNHSKCCDCVKAHILAQSLPVCMRLKKVITERGEVATQAL